MNEIQRALELLERKDDGHVPPQGAQSAGKRALALIKDGRAGSNFTGTGRARASQLARGEKLSESTIRRMHSYFSRHVNDKKPGWSDAGKETPGYVAWLAWGGDAGAAWARKMVRSWDGEKKELNLINHMGEQAETVEEVAAINGISNIAAAYGILGIADAKSMYPLAQKMLHQYRGEHSGDVMIAFELEPEFKRQISLPDGDDSGELHITLGYFGSPSNTITKESMEVLCTKLAASLEPMEFTVSGIARFSSEDGDDALVALVDHPELPAIYCRMLYLANRLQVNWTPNHGYTPHITLGWLDREDSMPLQRWQPIKARIRAIALHYGTDVRTYYLGWGGGKLGDQVKDVHAGNGGRRKTKKLKAVRRANTVMERC